MRTLMFFALAAALLASCAGLAQDQAIPPKEENRPAAYPPSKPLTVLGKVSDDGQTLMTDIDSEWAVGNAGTLKGYEGRRVSIRCYVDSEKNRIHVLSVRKEESAPRYAARYGDSAFRR